MTSQHSQGLGYPMTSMQSDKGSLKQKLAGLEDLIKGITEEVEYHKKEVQILRVEKDELEKVLAKKAAEVRENLQAEATRVEGDLKKNLSNQRTENQKLQNQISILKQEKTQLQQNLLGLQRRIGELELSIGSTANEQE